MTRSLIRLITGRRAHYLVILFWLVVVVVAAPLAGRLTDVEQNEAKSWLPGSAESVQVLDAQAAFASPNTIPAVVIYTRDSGLTPADRAKVAADAAAYAQLTSLGGKVIGPVPSADGKAAQTIVPLDLGPEGWSKAADVVRTMTDTADAGANGLTAYVTGPAGIAADSSKAFEGIDTTLLLGTVIVVVLILLFTYRSPVLWILPLFSSVVALMVAQGLIYFLAKYADLTVNGQSQAILTILVIGAGTDYALLLVARYREELRRHEDRHEAMAFALHRAAPAILASAATVVVSMLCLLFADLNSTAGLGPVAAVGIGVTLLVMITLLPALLVVTGRWVFWPKRPTYGSAEPTQ
ncbi:MAG TPA: MMPL family transporter, partial [Micromonosporaceae bacterium]